MSELHYPDLSITGFRGLRDLTLSPLGRVNLITGKNNTGKSSILEALRLHAENAALSTVYSILRFREENIRGTDEEERSYDPDSAFQISALFHGFPRASEDISPIVISTSGKSRRMELTMTVDWLREERDSEGRREFVPQKSLFVDSDVVPVLIIRTERGEQFRVLDSFRRSSYIGQRPRPGAASGHRMPCVLVNPYSGEGTYALGPLWDEIALTDNDRVLVEALRIIDPRISAISMVGGLDSPRSRTAIVRADNLSRPVPLRSFGDGLNRLFAIVLSLVNARGGTLLIDEFENGLHHTVQLDAWRMIFRLAHNLDVQVFATSHSSDAVLAFQEAADETPEAGVFLHLTRRGDDIFPTVLSEDELAIATRDEIEVR